MFWLGRKERWKVGFVCLLTAVASNAQCTFQLIRTKSTLYSLGDPPINFIMTTQG